MKLNKLPQECAHDIDPYLQLIHSRTHEVAASRAGHTLAIYISDAPAIEESTKLWSAQLELLWVCMPIRRSGHELVMAICKLEQRAISSACHWLIPHQLIIVLTLLKVFRPP